MSSYTMLLQTPFDSISPDDDDFIDKLLNIAQLFRPFSIAMDEFIQEHGFNGNIGNIDAKVLFIRDAFEKASIDPTNNGLKRPVAWTFEATVTAK